MEVRFIGSEQPQGRGRGISHRVSGQSAGPPSAPSLLAFINGTDMETRFFAAAKRATETGFALHSCSVASFWTNLVPQLAHQHEPIRHALVALGATYHLFKLQGSSSQPDATYETRQLGHFAIRQYNKAITKLNQTIERQDHECVSVSLLCCLLFISLEILSCDYQKAVVHLKSGVQLITTAVDIEHLDRSSSRPWSAGSKLSEADLWGTIVQFRNAEYVLSGFAPGIPLALGRRLYKLTRPRTGFGPIQSVEDSYRARIHYVDKVMDCSFELRKKQAPAPNTLQQLRELRRQGTVLMYAIRSFWYSAAAPPIGSWESFSTRLDCLAVASARLLVDLLPFGANAIAVASDVPHIQQEVTRVTNGAEQLLNSHAASGLPPSDFSLETGLIALMFWVLKFSASADTKATAMRILQSSTKREGPWDSNYILTSLDQPAAPRLLSGWQTHA